MVARNTVLNVAGRLLPLAVGVLLMPAIVHGLGTARFGVLSLAWALVGYSALLDFGIGTAATKFISEAIGANQEDKVSSILLATVLIQGSFALLGGLAVAAAVPAIVHHLLRIPVTLSKEVITTFYLLVATFPLVLIAGAFQGLLASYQRFDLINLVSAPTGIATFAVPYVIVLLRGGLPEIIVGLLVVRAITLLVLIILSVRMIPRRDGFSAWPGWETFKALSIFGAWLSGPRLVQPVVSPLDRVFVTRFVSLTALAYYSAPYDMLRRLGFVTNSLGTAIYPAFGVLSGSGDSIEARRLFERSFKVFLLFLGVVMGLIFVFAHDGLKIWLGEDFARYGALPLRILTVGLTINWLNEIPVNFLRAYGRADLPAKAELVVTPLDLALLYGLVRLWGIDGAALAVALGLAADSLVIFYFCYNAYGLPSLSSLRECVSTAMTVVSLVALAYVSYNWLPLGLAARSVITAAVFITMIFAIWGRILNDEDRAALIRVARSFGVPVARSAPLDSPAR